MFLNSQDSKKIGYYEEMLKIIGSLSRLFSESSEPYIQYRIAENLFCKSFEAHNLSRTDCSADASKDRVGFGVKTFLEKNGATMQKVAEFNSDQILFRSMKGEDLVRTVANLRNERIEATRRIFGLNSMIYHCVTRKESGILVYETPMDLIAENRIRNVVVGKNVINFEDGINEYSFNITKSTLYKRFLTQNIFLNFRVNILEDPFGALETLLKKVEKEIVFAPRRQQEHILLPLYSYKKEKKAVSERSGLNQWNALGRPRDANEVYIPIPAWIHRVYPAFFPPRDESFNLVLPNRENMNAKVCQDNSKALMSNPNSALGSWLLRNVLNLKEKELLNYEKLQRIGLDSVVIYKIADGQYDIDFTKLGSYENFREQNLEYSDSEDEE